MPLMPGRPWTSVVAAATAAMLVGAQTEILAWNRASRHVRTLSSRTRRGRPRKFDKPSRAVTLTLPEDVIAALYALDEDLSRAVLRAVQPLLSEPPRPPAEVTTYGGNRAVIIVPQSRALKARTDVELVPLPDGRALLAFGDQTSISEFELKLIDGLGDPTLGDADRTLFTSLVEILRNVRRENGIELRRRNIIVLRWTGETAGGEDEQVQPKRRERAG